MNTKERKTLLDAAEKRWNQKQFIAEDPISVPHRFSKKQDIEIAGLFAAVLAWGQRKTIIRNCNALIEHMENAPHDFVLHHQDADLKKMEGFVHRTFNTTDLLYFISFLQYWYQKHESLEDLFFVPNAKDTGKGLIQFHQNFFNLPWAPQRTRKHIPTPERKSACKRLNMYLRWMVRKDENGVDFGIWQRIQPAQLICPLDVHVSRTARNLGLLARKQDDWQAALELTENLRKMDAIDPVRYDYALFGLSLEKGL